MLQEMAFESALRIGECSMRVGLAATAWQLDQAQALLEYAGLMPKSQALLQSVAPTQERVVALALETRLGRPRSALATISLHRDGDTGLSLDASHAAVLNDLRSRGEKLAEIEHLAFDSRLSIPHMIGPMVRALSSVVVDNWGSTGVVMACARKDAAFYCESLGFRRATKGARDHEVLLHLPTSRLGHLLAPSLGSARLPD